MKAGAQYWRTLVWSLITALVAVTPANALLDPFHMSNFYRPQVFFKEGAVYSRALVLQEGKPIWVTYSADGKVAEEIGPAVGKLEGAHVMAASTFAQLVAQLNALKSQYHLAEGDILTRDDYLSSTFTRFDDKPMAKPELAEGTRFVAVKPQAQRYLADGSDLLLMELPIDPNLSIAPKSQSLLLTKDGALVWQTEKTIGYKTGFEDREKKEYYGPLKGVTLEVSGEPPIVTNEKGRYSALLHLPPCPGFYIEYYTNIYLDLYYKRFNPRSDENFPYYMAQEDTDICNGLDFLGMAEAAIVHGSVSTAQPKVVFPVDIMVLAGKASLKDVTVGGATTYGSRSPLHHVAQQQYDLDGDGQPDTAKLGNIVEENGERTFIPAANPEEAKLQGVWLSSGDTTSPLPHLTRLPDWSDDFENRGLLNLISAEDFKNTDLYVFRETDGSLLIERRGLNPDETGTMVGTDADSGTFFYTLPLIGAVEFTQDFSYAKTQEQYQSFQKNVGFIDEKQHRRKADHLRPGETVRLLLINRATGYIGSRSVMLQAAGQGKVVQEVSFPIDDILMLPPNLKLWARRKYQVEYGLTKDKQREYAIGNEGAALTNDNVIEIYSEWFDQDGQPLPEALGQYGYTGRIAKLVEANRLEAVGGSFSSCEPACDGSTLSEFAIKPGRQLQVVRLPDKAVGKNHLYLHVSGEPKNRGTADFSDGNPNLPGRPRLFVPVKVPVYDETTSLQAVQAYHLAKQNNPTQTFQKPEPVYRYLYRPEFQFSVFDLEVEEIRRTDIDSQTSNILDVRQPVITSSDQLLSLYYSLAMGDNGQGLPPLPGYSFEGNKELVFALGAEEIKATVNGTEPVHFDNFNHLGQLRPEDYLALSLYANNDTGNVLWEWAFAYLNGEPKSTNISADNPTVDLVVHVPGEPEGSATLIWQVEGNGAVSPTQSTSDIGIFTTTLRTGTQVGTKVYVVARVVSSEVAQAPEGAEIRLGPFTVQPGQPQHIEVGGNTRTLPADTLSDVSLSATVYDGHNNKVADETPVDWILDFDGALANATTQTANGTTSVSYMVGKEIGPSSVTLAAGSAEQTFEIQKQKLNATLSASQTILPAGTQGTTTLTLATDAKDGTPVTWNTTRGQFVSAAEFVSGGHAIAVLRAASAPGDGIVTATVASRTEHIQIAHTANGPLAATFDHAAIVSGDLSGSVSVDGLRGPESYSTLTETSVTVQGTPGARLSLAAGGFYSPNATPTLHYAMNGVENGAVYDQISQTPAVVLGSVQYDTQQSFTLPGASLAFDGGHLLVDPVPELDAQEGLFANIRFRVSPDAPATGEATLIRKSVVGTGLPGFFGMGDKESWSLHVTSAQTLEARVTTDQGTVVAALPTTIVPGRWYIAGLRLRNGTLELGLNGERARTPFVGAVVGAGGSIDIGTGFSGHLDDVKLGVETPAKALFTFAGGAISQELVIGADGTARVGLQATTNDPGEQGHIVGLTAYEQTPTTAGLQLRERELRIGGLSGLLGIQTAYADEIAAQQEAGIATVRPVKWGNIAQWVGEKVFGDHFDTVKATAEFVYQLTAVSDVVTLLKAVVAFAEDGDARNVDGFEVTFATISIGVTVLSAVSGAGVAALPEIRSGLTSMKPLLKEMFDTGAPAALQTGKILGRYIFDLIKKAITHPGQALDDAAEFASALKDTVLGTVHSVGYVFRTIRSLSDLQRWLRLRRLKNTCLVAQLDEPYRRVAIGPEGQFWLLDNLSASVADAIFGRRAHAEITCPNVLTKLAQIEADYGPSVHNAVAKAVDVLHSHKNAKGENILRILDENSFNVLAKVAQRDPALVAVFAQNATRQFPTKTGRFKLAVTGEAIDTMLGYVAKIDPSAPGYREWTQKLGQYSFLIKAIAGEAQGIEAVKQMYHARGVTLHHLNDRVDIPYEKLDADGEVIIATRNKEGVDAEFRLGDGTPVFMEAKAISGNTGLGDDEIYKRIVDQYEKHLTTKVLPYVEAGAAKTYKFNVDGKNVAPIMHYHLVGNWFTPERVAEINKRLDRALKDSKFDTIRKAKPSLIKNITVGDTIPSITN